MTRHAWGLYRYARLTHLIIPDSITEHPAMSDTIPNSAYGRYVREHADFFRRPELIVAFLTGKWRQEQGYRLIKELWAFGGNRIIAHPLGGCAMAETSDKGVVATDGRVFDPHRPHDYVASFAELPPVAEEPVVVPQVSNA